jgi:hypothetical protein
VRDGGILIPARACDQTVGGSECQQRIRACWNQRDDARRRSPQPDKLARVVADFDDGWRRILRGGSTRKRTCERERADRARESVMQQRTPLPGAFREGGAPGRSLRPADGHAPALSLERFLLGRERGRSPGSRRIRPPSQVTRGDPVASGRSTPDLQWSGPLTVAGPHRFCTGFPGGPDRDCSKARGAMRRDASARAQRLAQHRIWLHHGLTRLQR